MAEPLQQHAQKEIVAMTQQQNRTIRHIHYDVTSLLNMNDKQLSECVSHPDGVEAARLDLQSMFDSGKTCLVLSGDCDNKNPNGSCAGHPDEVAA
jgi:hypothetical protein